MNRTGIEYLTHTWSPITGCLHSQDTCPIRGRCWARAYARRFPGRYASGFGYKFHAERLWGPLQHRAPTVIGVSLMGDIGGDWVPWGDRERVIQVARICPQHTFLFLTKAPHSLTHHRFPPNAWVGASACDQEGLNRVLPDLARVDAPIRWLSLEPLLGPVNIWQALPGNRVGFFPDWIVAGAQTGPGARRPEEAWVLSLLDQVRGEGLPTPIFLKDNLLALLPGLPPLRERPHKAKTGGSGGRGGV